MTLLARALGPVVVALALILIANDGVSAQEPTPQPDDRSWKFVDVEVGPDDPVAGSIARVQFSIEDQDGEPVAGLRASAMLRPPSSASDTEPPAPVLSAVGRELSDPARYEVSLALNRSGRWWIEIRVEDPDGMLARYDHFVVVDAVEDLTPPVTSQPLFLRGDDWKRFFRIDAETGSVITLSGDELFRVNDSWWLGRVTTEPVGTVSTQYGGTWTLTAAFRDAITGEQIISINVGEIRANLHIGSGADPAIATSIAVSSDGRVIYVYWARQLGQGWVANLATVDSFTGEPLQQRIINGAIASTGFWADLTLLDEGRLMVVEQVVQRAQVTGYRLTVVDAESLELMNQYRRTEANGDPLTHCMLSYPGPIGPVGEGTDHRYALCSPPGIGSDLSLVIWDPINGDLVHTVDLESIAEDAALYADGVASPDGEYFYAVNTRTMRIAEIDMAQGVIVRERNLLPDDDDPSTLDRFFDWVFGAWAPPAGAAGSVEPAVTISAAGDRLYVISQPENREPGVLVIDIENLDIVNSLFTGQQVDGLVATVDGRIAVIERGEGDNGDQVTILDDQGGRHLSVTLPGRSDVIGSRR